MAKWGHAGNPEIYLPRMKAYYQANKEKWNTPEHKAKDKAWRDANAGRRLEQANVRREAARKYIGRIKQRPCEDCGISFPWYVMDLDHVRGDKISDVSSMCDNGVSLRRIREEVAKCDVVCSNCHRIRTHQRRGTRDVHQEDGDFQRKVQ